MFQVATLTGGRTAPRRRPPRRGRSWRPRTTANSGNRSIENDVPTDASTINAGGWSARSALKSSHAPSTAYCRPTCCGAATATEPGEKPGREKARGRASVGRPVHLGELAPHEDVVVGAGPCIHGRGDPLIRVQQVGMRREREREGNGDGEDPEKRRPDPRGSLGGREHAGRQQRERRRQLQEVVPEESESRGRADQAAANHSHRSRSARRAPPRADHEDERTEVGHEEHERTPHTTDRAPPTTSRWRRGSCRCR